MKAMQRERFAALVAPTRTGPQLWRELEWWASDDESAVGTVVLDLIDKDYSWVMLGKEDDGRYRAWELNASLKDQDAARRELHSALCARDAGVTNS